MKRSILKFLVLCSFGIINAAEQHIPRYTLTLELEGETHRIPFSNRLNTIMYGCQKVEEEIAQMHRAWRSFNRAYPHTALGIKVISSVGIGIGIGLLDPLDTTINIAAMLDILHQLS